MKWFLLFLSIPLLEIFIFLKINNLIGIISTLSLIILTALVGSYFVKNQITEIMNAFKNQERDPFSSISNGLIIFVAGIFLLTPGFLTDILGFSLLIPSVRTFIISKVSKSLIKH